MNIFCRHAVCDQWDAREFEGMMPSRQKVYAHCWPFACGRICILYWENLGKMGKIIPSHAPLWWILGFHVYWGPTSQQMCPISNCIAAQQWPRGKSQLQRRKLVRETVRRWLRPWLMCGTLAERLGFEVVSTQHGINRYV